MKDRRPLHKKQGPGQLELGMDLPAHPAPVADTDPRRWLKWAAMEWRTFHQREMTVRWARDLSLIKPLLRQHGADELSARWRAYVQTMDEYIARRGWDVPTFSTSIDRYAGDTDCAEIVRQWNLRPGRDPLTGVVRQRRR